MGEQDKTERLQQIISGSNNIVFFGGAGVSTESGIPDFRSVDGLYNMKYKFPPEEILSHSFYMANKEEFYRFHRDKILVDGAKPNAAHYKLAELEKAGKLKAVITQNIDGLHQMAGSENVVELHGSISRNYCEQCGNFYSREYVRQAEGVPHCACGGDIKPDVVLYEEPLDAASMNATMAYIGAADVLIIGGTSLAVWPAASLIDFFDGSSLVLINRAQTERDPRADLVISDSIGKVLGAIRC